VYAVRNWEDPITLEPIQTASSFRLIEPGGCEYIFNPVPLAHHFLVSALFVHPITQRKLISVEIRRLARSVSFGKILLMTWTARDVLKKSIDERQSLVDFCESEVGAKWQILVSTLEGDDGHSILVAWDEYVTSVVQLATRSVCTVVKDHMRQALHLPCSNWLCGQLVKLCEAFPPKRNEIALQIYLRSLVSSLNSC
jgi:hypothetical protein